MNSKHFFASAALASMFAVAVPANAQVLGGGLSGVVGTTLSGGLSGAGGLGGVASTATGSVRDVNSIARASTQHTHDTVSAAADATDRAATNVDKQLESTAAAANATGNAASSAASSVNTDVAEPKLSETKAEAPRAKTKEPIKSVKTVPPKASNAEASVGASSSANGSVSAQR
jgi:hypothetical protein